MRDVRAALPIALALSCGGCLDRPINGTCAWPGEPAVHLDLRTGSDRRHLDADARFAEELAIHYADVTRGKRSGHFTDFDEYHRTREQCLAALSVDIASRHGISPPEVVGAVGRRDQRLDGLVLLIFASIFAFAANSFARRLFVRFPPDEPWPALIGTAAAAVAVSVTGVVAGWIGSTIVETIQLGDTHMSYRAERMLWSRHWPAIFLGCMIVFSLIAALRWRTSARRHNEDVLSADYADCAD